MWLEVVDNNEPVVSKRDGKDLQLEGGLKVKGCYNCQNYESSIRSGKGLEEECSMLEEIRQCKDMPCMSWELAVQVIGKNGRSFKTEKKKSRWEELQNELYG